MRARDIYASRFLNARDLEGRPPVKLTVTRVAVEELGDQRPKVLLFFNRGTRALAMNRTNIAIMERICGTDEIEAWVGAEILLAAEPVSYRGQAVSGLRIRPVAPPEPPAPRPGAVEPFGAPPPDEDIPF